MLKAGLTRKLSSANDQVVIVRITFVSMVGATAVSMFATNSISPAVKLNADCFAAATYAPLVGITAATVAFNHAF